MYTCVYGYMSVYIYIYIYICIHVWYLHWDLYIETYIYIYIYIQTRTVLAFRSAISGVLGCLKTNASCKTQHFSDCWPWFSGPRTIRSHAYVVPCYSLIISLNVAFCWSVCASLVMSLGTTLCNHCRGWEQSRHGFVCPWRSFTSMLSWCAVASVMMWSVRLRLTWNSATSPEDRLGLPSRLMFWPGYEKFGMVSG